VHRTAVTAFEGTINSIFLQSSIGNFNPVTDGLIYFPVNTHSTASRVKKINCKGEVHPRTGHEVPEGE